MTWSVRTAVRAPRRAAVTAVTAVTAAAVGAGSAAAHDSVRSYGYTAVRSAVPADAGHFSVTSPDVRDGGTFPAAFYADAFGCTAANRQVRLAWSGAPRGTQSYAVTMFDPDAPSGAGFWHWLTWDIPAGTRTLGGTPPPGAVAGTDDAGATGYLGPCPPAGDIPHRYVITVYALDVPSLDLPAATPATVTTFTMSSHITATARLTATAAR
jgi:Raf kinase inhibitor-like YbhB/YbcL family protein